MPYSRSCVNDKRQRLFTDDDYNSDASIQLTISDSETQEDDTSTKDTDEQVLKTTTKKRKAHGPKNQATDVKKVKPQESKDSEKNKNNDKQESEVNKTTVNKHCERRDSFYKCTCEGKFTTNIQFLFSFCISQS